MDNSVMRGSLLPASTAGILELEASLHRQPSMIPHSQNHHQQQPHHLHPAMALSTDHPMSLINPSPSKSTAPHHRGKLASSSASDEEDDHEPSFANDDGGGARTKKGGSSSPWHRMKWTDEMVRLLITVVACVGDDGNFAESCDGPVGTKRKAGSGGVLQKKGKWKTVSKLMLEKGCYVSPQQCEDKFNDLNKRYKRLNEILGRGTTCQVVENPSLLDSMHHVPPKAKDDVRKILSSKHLFYREMCAYHNGQRIPNSNEIELPHCAIPAVGSLKDADRGRTEEEEEENEDEGNVDVQGRNFDVGKVDQDSFQVEMDGVLQDPTKSVWEQRDWFRNRALQLQEERVEIQAEAFELEKQRFKWQRFCSKKDRELERMKLENERMALENERMMMQVKEKEVELQMRKSLEEPGGFAGFRVDGE